MVFIEIYRGADLIDEGKLQLLDAFFPFEEGAAVNFPSLMFAL